MYVYLHIRFIVIFCHLPFMHLCMLIVISISVFKVVFINTVYKPLGKEVLCRNNFLKNYKLPFSHLVTDLRGGTLLIPSAIIEH
jgi:hypothetical protein